LYQSKEQSQSREHSGLEKVEALRGGEIDSFISGEDNRGSLGPILTVRDDVNDTDPRVTACEVKELLQI